MSKKNGITSSARAPRRAVESWPAALAGVTLMALPGLAAADELSGVTVTAAPKQISSPKYMAPLIDTPQTVTIVDTQLIRQQNLLGLRDVLSTLPGITFGAGEGGGGYGDKINLRGFSADNDITVDNVRDSAQYSRTDPFNLQQVEVINGSNSVYGGAGSVGGSINLVTKRPAASNMTTITGAVGLHDYARATADINRQFLQTGAFRLNLMAHKNDVPGRDVEKYERWGIAPAITLGIGTPTQATLMFTHQEDDNTPQYGVPYAGNAFNNGPLPGADPSDYFGYRNIDEQKTRFDSLSFILEHRFNDAITVRNLTRWQEVTQDTTVDPPQGTYCLASGIDPFTGAACAALGTYAPGGPRGNFRNTKNQILANQTDFLFNFSTAGLVHNLVAGVSLSNETYHLDTGRKLRNPLGATPDPVLPVMSISNPDSLYTGPINNIQTAFTDSEVNNRAIYAFDRIEIGKFFEVNGGIRYEKNEGHSTTASYAVPYPAPPASPVVTVNPPANNNDNLLSYRAGVVFKPIEDASIYFAYGNSVTPSQATVNGGCTAVSVTGTANCNLDPEKARTYEFGAKYNALGGKLLLTAAIFRNERTNFRVASGDPTVPQQQLDGAARVDGVALGAAGEITDNWSIFANYTYLDSKVLQNISNIAITGGALDFQAGDPLPVTPKHSMSLWTTYKLPYHVTIGYGATYTGSYTFNRPSATAGLFYTPSYWVHRAMVSYEVTERLTAQINVENLFDETYYTNIRNNATSGWATPGAARTAVFNLTYSF